MPNIHFITNLRLLQEQIPKILGYKDAFIYYAIIPKTLCSYEYGDFIGAFFEYFSKFQ